MEEAQVAQKLAESVPKPVESAPVIPEKPTGVIDHTPVEFGLDELTQYKLHDVFNEIYQPNDEQTKQKLTYIYEEVKKLAGTDEYVHIVSKIRELMQVAGIARSENQIPKLHEWLRLRKIANDAHRGMENLRG